MTVWCLISLRENLWSNVIILILWRRHLLIELRIFFCRQLSPFPDTLGLLLLAVLGDSHSASLIQRLVFREVGYRVMYVQDSNVHLKISLFIENIPSSLLCIEVDGPRLVGYQEVFRWHWGLLENHSSLWGIISKIAVLFTLLSIKL